MIADALENIDLSGVFAIACLAGTLLCVVSMSLIPVCSNSALYWAQRSVYLGIGLVLAWSYVYASRKGWQPHPPHLLLIAVLDCTMLLRIVINRTDFMSENGRISGK